MSLFQMILECSDDEVQSLIDEAIRVADINSEKVDKLGFLDSGKLHSVFKGFIPLNARIRYSNLSIEDYSMNSADFFYEFAFFLRKYNINNKASFVFNLESFINSYFGLPGGMDREIIFNDIAWQTTTTDEEYFEALKNNKIGDLKGKKAAMCTERSALAQQLLSLFGTESYYCMGCVDLEDKQECHCFNIVKRQNDYALLDYSVAVPSYTKDGNVGGYYPFVGTMTNEDFQNFIQNGTIKSFDDYYMVGTKPIKTGSQRMYVVGAYEIAKNKAVADKR